jgi:hypothetical protein
VRSARVRASTVYMRLPDTLLNAADSGSGQGEKPRKPRRGCGPDADGWAERTTATERNILAYTRSSAHRAASPAAPSVHSNDTSKTIPWKSRRSSSTDRLTHAQTGACRSSLRGHAPRPQRMHTRSVYPSATTVPCGDVDLWMYVSRL